MIQRRISDSPDGRAGEQRRAVEHDRQPGAALVDRLHLRDHVLEEQERPVVDAWEPGAEAAGKALRRGLVAHRVGDLLPLHTERRVGE